MYVVFIIFVCKATLSEVGVIFLVGSDILIFGMGMPPILKSFGGYKLKKTANLIDQLMHVLVNDKINSAIYETVVTCLLLIVNLFLFWICLKIGTIAFKQYAIEAIGIIFLIDTYVDKRKNQKQDDISSI